MTSAGRILIMPKGNYDASVTYEMLDLVYYNGKSWLAKKTTIGIEPSKSNSEFWHDMLDIDTIVSNKIESQNGEWIYPELLSPFETYPVEYGDARVRYRKVGSIVFIHGVVTNAEEIAKGNITPMFTIPEGYRPSNTNIQVLSQGSGMNKWLLSVSINGNVSVQRYGTTEDINIPQGTWLPIDVCYSLG
jgi:hypothetical protein